MVFAYMLILFICDEILHYSSIQKQISYLILSPAELLKWPLFF